MLTENPEEFANRLQEKIAKAQAQTQHQDDQSCDEMSSDNDSVSEVNENQFQQHHYLFLFDDELQIPKDAPLDEVLTPEQFEKMKMINRRKLCEFFEYIVGCNDVHQKEIVMEVSHGDGPGEKAEITKKVITICNEDMSSHSANTDMMSSNSKNQQSTKQANGFAAVKRRASFVKEWKQVPDEEIDTIFKLLLQSKQNGSYLSPEIVAHYEYFMNTLNMSHKYNTENPFEHPLKYPALQYKGLTLMPSSSHSDAIMESANSDENSQSSDSQKEDHDQEDHMLIDTDDIIDQSMIIAETQQKRGSETLGLNNMTPQNHGKYRPRLSIQQQRKLSVRHEIRRQSNMYVQNLSIFERNRLLTKPNTHMKKVRDHVRNDKKSILSSQMGSDIRSRHNSYNKGANIIDYRANLIENQEIQMRIIKKSVNQLRPKGSWYPNQQLEGIISAKFSGSPQPKKFNQGKLGKFSSAFGSPVKDSAQRNLLNFELNPFKIGDTFQEFENVDDGLAAYETTQADAVSRGPPNSKIQKKPTDFSMQMQTSNSTGFVAFMGMPPRQ